MKAKSKSRATRKTKDVLRFSPGFTVYVLPPESICLYAEHRKLFLHGMLFCAIASAVGNKGKSRAALLRELAQKFPTDQIEEALKRLTDRGYLVAASPVN